MSTHGAMGYWILPHGGSIGLFLFPAIVSQLVCAILSMGWLIIKNIFKKSNPSSGGSSSLPYVQAVGSQKTFSL